MATPLDNIRNEYPDAFTNYTDDELVQYLYENDTAYKDMDYNQFKTLATAPGQEPVSPKPSQIKKSNFFEADTHAKCVSTKLSLTSQVPSMTMLSPVPKPFSTLHLTL